MAELNTTPKPPPLHERWDVLEDIVRNYNGGNNLEIVQAEMRGALKILTGTAIPKGHDKLVTIICIATGLIEMSNAKETLDALEWIGSEQRRHNTPPAPPPVIVGGLPLEGQPPAQVGAAELLDHVVVEEPVARSDGFHNGNERRP